MSSPTTTDSGARRYNLENCFSVSDNCRHNFDAELSRAEIEETFLAPFETSIEEGAASGLMCSYNAVNGTPSCANDWARPLPRDTSLLFGVLA